MSSVVLLDPEGDALTQSLLALRGSLEVQERSTGDVLSILETVDDRLASLERHMAPIRRVTEQLSTAERNVIGSYDAMKKVQDNFRVASEVDTVLRKGLVPPSLHFRLPAASAAAGIDGEEQQQEQGSEAGGEEEEDGGEESRVDAATEQAHAEAEAASIAAHVEAVERVQGAIKFLRLNARMRSADAALRQLEMRQQRLLGDMREEVRRVLASKSRCELQLVPVADAAGVGGLDYRAADPIAPSAARRVRALVDSLLRAGDTRWGEQAYAKGRQPALEAALRPFLERQQQVLLGKGGGGGVDVAVGVTQDRARPVSVSGMVEDALGLLTLSPKASRSVRVPLSTAAMAVGGGVRGPEGEWVRYLQFVRELVKAEDTLFQRALPGSHFPAPCTAAYLELLSPLIAKTCGQATETLQALVAREKARPGEQALLLLGLVQGAKKEMPALAKLLKGLTTTTEAGAAAGAAAAGGGRPVSMNMTTAYTTASASANGPWELVLTLYHTMCRLAIHALTHLVEDVANDPAGASSRYLPPNATVHVVTSNTLRTFKRLMAHAEAFTELSALKLVPSLPWELSEDEDEADEEEEEEEGSKHLRAYAAHLFMSLLRNLRAKADGYARLGEGGVDALSQAGRPHLFLMNNAHYMISTVQGSAVAAAATSNNDAAATGIRSGGLNSPMARAPSVPIATALSEAFIDRLAAVVQGSRAKFVATVWGALAEEVKDLNLPLEYQKAVGAPQQQLTFDSGRLIKARFASFNDRLEALYPCQKAFAVPDPTLRAELREEAKAAVLPAYTAFFAKYGGLQFSRKHMEAYLRFPPATVASMIEELYAG